jgi:peptidoglycan hydrolase-like protein with peptidoglycan-binding domain
MNSRFAALIVASAFLLSLPNIASSTSTSTSASAGTEKAGSGSKTAASSKTKKSRSAKHRSTKPSYQARPTAERYREIQQALADKGYFKGEIDGTWGQDSIDALKKFQTDHQITDDGKINSLSLIQLGLGPKHETAGQPSSASPLAVPAEGQPASKISE